ncbi:hypothetical protein HDU81_010579 [Chytriomyces hyalinus]|nr:hypothetical protein HDU81_010579 [Chytriomyces hyalinus]
MVRITGSATRSSVMFGGENPPSPTPTSPSSTRSNSAQGSYANRAHAQSSSIHFGGDSPPIPPQSSNQQHYQNQSSFMHGRSRPSSRQGASDQQIPPTSPLMPAHNIPQIPTPSNSNRNNRDAQYPVHDPAPASSSSYTSGTGADISSGQATTIAQLDTKFESQLQQLHAKLDAQNELLVSMFAYVKRIDGEAKFQGDEISALRQRFDRISIVWVPKGAAKEAPTRFQMSESEYESIQSKIATHIKDIKDEQPAAAAASTTAKAASKDTPTAALTEEEAVIKEFDLDNYDNEDDSVDFMGDGEGGDDDDSDDDNGNMSAEEGEEETGNDATNMFASVKGLTYHDGDSADPYVTLDDSVNEAEELEEMMVAPTDNLILAARTEDDISHIEVYLYEGEEDNLFVHHDIMLPSFPLCLEWMNYDIEGKGQGKRSFVAVGTFDPEIEIWDLDVIDASYPTLILGGSTNPTEALGTGKKKRRSKKPSDQYHVDAVMCLAWNKMHPSLLASGSADTTIKLWDLSSSTPEVAIRSFTNHKAKVQGLAWNPSQGQVLLSGGYDKQSHIFDTRTPASVLSFKLTADVECLKWDPLHPERFLVSTEDGIVKCFDGRSPKTPVFTIHAHDGAVSALDVSSRVDGLVVTGSTDKATKVWSTKDATAIKCLASRDLQVGKVYSAAFSPDDDMVVGVAGGAGKMMVWNLEGNASVRRVVRGVDDISDVKRKEFTGVEDDKEGDSEDEMDEDD